MEISPTSPAAASAPPKAEPKADGGLLSADFQTFLALLTSQMRNQDPLKPVESTEFIAQLAAFSEVEQQVRTNDRLDAMVELLGGGSAGLAEWIGREVRAPGKADFSGDPIEVGMTPVSGADRAVLVVRNDFDQVVARAEVAADADTVDWDGTDGLGTPLADGRYRFVVESYSGDALIDAQEGSVFATVAEVRIAGGQSLLVLEDGTRVALGDVSAVR